MPKQDVKVDLYYDGAWHDLVANDDVFTDTPITITRGDGDESAAPRPSSISLRLANDDDLYRTSNPMSPLYGKAGVNTLMRVRVGSAVRGIGEVSSWKAGQTRDFRASPRRGKAWVDVEANGLLQRINQWTEQLESTMVAGMRSFGSSSLGIWPLEDEANSAILSQLVPGGPPGTFSGDVTLGDSERPAGSSKSVRIDAGGRIGGTFIGTSASGWQISFAVRLPAPPPTSTKAEIFSWTDSVGRRWTWEVNNTDFGWAVYSNTGSLITSLTSPFAFYDPNKWVRLLMVCKVSGSTVSYFPSWYVEGLSFPVGTSGTFSSTTTGTLRTWTAVATTHNDGAWYTGVFAINDPTVSMWTSNDVVEDFNGHAGETAGARFTRIMTDKSLPFAVTGDSTKSTRMGGQPVDTLAELLKEIRDTDDGVLFDSRTGLGLILALRNNRYNQTPALTLDVNANPSGLPNLPVEVTDDLPIHNIVTASQRDGGQFTAQDSTTVMGTQAPPNGRGEYKQTVDVNVFDEANDLPQQANWWLRRGTVNLPRFPQVVVNVAALGTSKIAEVEAVTIGSVIEITNYREYTIRLFVIGSTEVIGTHSRIITFTCAPDQQFVVGKYGDSAKRYDLRSCTLAAGATSSATSLSLTMSIDEAWSTASPPYDLLISGERVRVTAMSARSGTGPYTQTATVTRSINGIVKALPSGSDVHIATPGRWAL
jgi:hypothetical protein